MWWREGGCRQQAALRLSWGTCLAVIVAFPTQPLPHLAGVLFSTLLLALIVYFSREKARYVSLAHHDVCCL